MLEPQSMVLLGILGLAFVALVIANLKVGIFIFLVTLPFQSVFFWAGFMFMSLSDIFAGLIFISWLVLLMMGKARFPRKKVLIFLVFILAVILLGCFTSIDEVTSLRFALRLLSFYAVFVVLLSIMDGMKMMKLVLWALAIQLAVISTVTCWKYLTTDTIIEDITDIDEEYEQSGIRQSGIAKSMNATAFNLTILMPLTLGLALMENRKLLIPVLILAVAALFITMSRGGWIAFCVSLFFLPRLKLKHVVSLALVFAILFCVFYSLFVGRIEATNPDSNSITIRLLMWDFTFYLLKENPVIGIGSGNFGRNAYDVYPRLRERLPLADGYSNAHNQYLEILAENGILGLTVYLMFLAFTATYIFSHTRSGDGRVLILRRSVRAAFVVVLVYQMFATYGIRNYLYWCVIALVFCVHDLMSKMVESQKTESLKNDAAIASGETVILDELEDVDGKSEEMKPRFGETAEEGLFDG